MNISKRVIALIILTHCFINIYSPLNAQKNSGIGQWNAIILRGKIAPRFAAMGECHIKNNSGDLKFNYFEIKGGISYAITRNLSGLVGTGIYNTYSESGFFQPPAVQKEFRTWLELFLKQALYRFNFDHRFRIEQRFIPGNYKNRIKYRLGMTVPLNKPEIVRGSAFIAINDELFIPQYGDRLVEKNRLLTGLGYKMSESTAFQIGCVSDTDYLIHSHTIKNYLQLMLIYDFSKTFRRHT